MEKYRGGCSCGQVRFELSDHPVWVIACHCNECKKRTGSDYGISVMTASDNVSEFTGETKTFIRTGDSGSDVQYEFCPNCGTTVRWKVALLPGREAFAGGAFDDISALRIAGELYADRTSPWVKLGCDLQSPEAPDNPFRQKLIDKAISLR